MSKSPESPGAELSAAERRLLALGWNETLSALSAGLTHDLCNAMTGIVSLSEVLLMGQDADEKTRKGFALIRDTALKAGQLAQHVYRLQQDAPGEKSVLDLNQEICNHAALLQKLLTRRIAVQTTLEAGQLPVEADPIELRQIVLNVAVDCAKAMPKGGHVLFRTARLHSAPTRADFKSTSFCPEEGRPWVELTIEQSAEADPAARSVDSKVLRDAFLSGDSKQPASLGIWRAVLFAERHAAALASGGEARVLRLWLPCADLSTPTA